MSYSQRVTWKQSQGCKQCQMLPQRYRYVQLRKQITYVGSTSQACIFSTARRASHCHLELIFSELDVLFFFSHQNRTEPNRLSINTGYPLNVSQRTLSNYRSYRTLGFDPGVLDASQTHLPPERISTHELDAWQKDPRILPVYAVTEPTTVPDRSSHAGHVLLGHHYS